MPGVERLEDDKAEQAVGGSWVAAEIDDEYFESSRGKRLHGGVAVGPDLAEGPSSWVWKSPSMPGCRGGRERFP